MHKLLALAGLSLLAVSAARADENPDGIGTFAPSGSSFTADIQPPNGSTTPDRDEYVFQGYPGMVLKASVKAAKGSALTPRLVLVRPGGDVLSVENGLALKLTSSSAALTYAVDSTGWWQIRVEGDDDSTGAYTLKMKYGAPKPPPLPTASKGFSVATDIADINDNDEYAFEGYTGQPFSASLTIPKGSGLDPLVQLSAPDGTNVATAGLGTKETKLALSRTLDKTGTWRIRVLGEEINQTDAEHDDRTTGPYTLSVKLGTAPSVAALPDSNNQYRFTFPAVGGASIGYVLANDPRDKRDLRATFNSFRDPSGAPVAGFPGGLALKAFAIPPRLPIGDYTLTFDAPAGAVPPLGVVLTRTLALPRGAGGRAARLDAKEPVIRNNGITPTAGGPGTLVSVQVDNAIDPNFPDASPALFLDHVALTGVTFQGGFLRGTVPDTIPEGVFDVVVASSSGQTVSKADAFRRVPPPTVATIDPTVGTEGGGFQITITGTGFRPGRMGILLEGSLQPVTPDLASSTETSLTFTAPSRAPGFVVFGVKDLDSQLSANLPLNSFEYVATPAVSRVIPGLLPTLGNEIVTVQGANFSAADTVYLESAPNSGTYTAITTPQNPTFVNSRAHQFLAPPRTKGVYRVHVQDSQGQPNPPKTRNLIYYSFADITASTNLSSLGSDPHDGYTTALGDYDKDGDLDIFVSRRGNPADAVPQPTSMTRIVRNDGNGQFAEVTTTTIPQPAGDDWRADRAWLADVNLDGYVDLLLTTNTKLVPAEDLSHTRILLNEVRGGAGPVALERTFRDRTASLMAPIRKMKKYGLFGGDASEYVSDAWRGQDMWVGDIDKGATAPPEILLTHDEVHDDDNYQTDVFDSGVYCGNYCVAGGASFQYAYTFYWGGSRLFVWDKTAQGGQGRYKFDPSFFPRASGPLVPTVVPGGQTLNCSTHYNKKCKDTFTPFIGQHVTVGSINGDARLDVAVVNNTVVSRKAKINDPLLPTSSLQVGLNLFNPNEGSGITDMTGLIYNLGGTTLADAVTVGQPGYSDGNSYGVIATSRATQQGSGSVLRLFRYLPGASPGTFEDITSLATPPVTAIDTFQASHLAFVDADLDGDQDLVLLAVAPPSNGASALRILRNERVGNTVGNLRATLVPLLDSGVTPSEHYEGNALSIGDLTGDGIIDYVVTRGVPSGTGSQLRIIKTDK